MASTPKTTTTWPPEESDPMTAAFRVAQKLATEAVALFAIDLLALGLQLAKGGAR